MAVFNVSAVYTANGNSRSRPVVAEDSESARQIAEAEWDMAPNDPEFSWVVAARPDPDGEYERALNEAEQRRLEAAFYATPEMRWKTSGS